MIQGRLYRPITDRSPTATSLPPDTTAQAVPENITPPETPSDHVGTTQDSPTKPTITFQERIVMQRRRADRGPSLS
jgi:hypothetical protein